MIGLMVKKKNIGCREYRESGRFTISGVVRSQGGYARRKLVQHNTHRQWEDATKQWQCTPNVAR